ncbi:hypothetical protein QBC33DRAFT_513100 [Phialemonium atrogriseum]|uniref:Uncharacterized protein n=1 Tax=Phialemonium atrogriseum TaxID=1093897 RepID=A0AAJ0FNT9_9PEZI|nr:uncharacterized protein QBC33DRAFT_513100 [Phialemonium atrogriseum]KAK1769603.1 hypothetical protein QBC33DRAFT_513100 [Phialemonium atrogriseum]
MAATPVTEFLLINLKTASAVEEAGTPANRALLDAISTLKQAGEGNRVFFGRQLENPSIGVIAVRCGWTREAVGCLGEAFFAYLRQRHSYEARTFDNIEVALSLGVLHRRLVTLVPFQV